MYTAQLILLSVIFLATKVLYNISELSSLAVFQCPAGLLGTCPRVSINSQNAQFYCIKDKRYDRRHLFYFTLFKNLFCIWSTDIKKPMFTSAIFLSLFSRHQEHTNPTNLMNAKQYTFIFLLFLLSVPFAFDSLRTT